MFNWFYSLRENKVIQATDSIEEYTFLNCPQEYLGPFQTEFLAKQYKINHPNESVNFNKHLKEYYKFCYGEEM